MRVFAAFAVSLVIGFVPAAQAETVRAIAVSKPPPNNERRIALVIGNSNYKTSPLKNPVNDARAMAKALSETGFTVTLVEDGSQVGMRRAIRAFGDELLRGGTGLFYFAGHGMQVRGKNYLIPVNADIEREDEVEDAAVDANFVLQKMDSAKNALNILILDACRNNPFQRSFRSASLGLAQMDAPTGTLISFATAPGSVAADGTGENGLYTHHLLRAIRTPGLPVEQLFKQVRIGVTKDTADKQVPWESSSLRGDFFFLPAVPGSQFNRAEMDKALEDAKKEADARATRDRADMQSSMEKIIREALAKQRAQLEADRRGTSAAAPAPAPAARTDDRQIEIAFWESMKGSSNPADFHAYLERYPQGAFAPLARNRVNQLTAVAETKAATAPAPPAVAAAPKPAPPPVQVASISPRPPVVTATPAQAGSRWQYASVDVENSSRRFEHLVEEHGKSAAGTLETFQARDGDPSPWVYTTSPTLVGHANGWAMFSPLASGEAIEVGKSWSSIAVERIERCSTGSLTCSASARVVGREKVTVKAGTFDTLKVTVEVIFRGHYLLGNRQITYWYAPEVGRPVKYAMLTFGGSSNTTSLTDPNVGFELVAYQGVGGSSGGSIDTTLASAATGASAPILVASASPTRGAIAMAGPAIPKVGDRWEYQFRDISNSRTTKQTIEIGAAGPDGIIENVTAESGGVVSLQHGPGSYVSGAAFIQFAPYLLAYGIPAIGDLPGDVSATRLADCEGLRSCRFQSRVAGAERVTVPAGTFEATKVEVQILTQNQAVSGGLSAAGTIELTVWYSREAKRVIKATGVARGNTVMSGFEQTLQSFQLK